MSVLLEREEVNVPKKVLQFEEFLNNVLRSDLKDILDRRDNIYKHISDYLQLKNSILTLKSAGLEKQPLKTKYDLGCNFYAQAIVDDPSMIFVNVGLGCYVQFTLDEALTFIEKKTAELTSVSDKLTQDASKVKAHIKLVLEGLRELQSVSFKEPAKTPYRDVLS